MPFAPIEWQNNKVKIIDQTSLPKKLSYLYIQTAEEMFDAIKTLKIRGAPAIGIAAAFGLYLGIKDYKTTSFKTFDKKFKDIIKYLSSCRPTAYNLFGAMERLQDKVGQFKKYPIETIKGAILEETLKIQMEDNKTCQSIGEKGANLIKDADAILTHCNAGGLATSGYGTALAVIFKAKEQGKKIKVYVSETRPLLQGARLTCWELAQEKIDTTLICDNMAGEVMKEGKINKVIVGADRIALNGDTANKIGTYSLAVLASFHNIPFYVAAPISTFDPKIRTGEDIPIEQRDPGEIENFAGKRITPKGTKIYNPAFDVVPNSLITCIITEKKLVYPSYRKNIKKVL
ncbi:MAG: S-methyl-5-thioribose-1-phosphate isomerase [Candidatus Ratteibacteria bacterium]|nr:S-methyl-5-thioribose-1-phosphate isomerase [Candidatus Ratteibacteria bacterium]